jgi:dihydrofolate reductase
MKYPDKQLIVIGGAQIYKLLYPYIQEIHRTLVHCVFDADTFFPDFEKDFECLKSNFHTKDEKHLYNFEFQYWKRKNKR